MIRLNATYLGIELQCYKNGVPAVPDSLPTAILYRNGTATAQTVTVASTANTGRYLASFTTLGTGDGWSVFDHLTVRVVAVLDTVPFPALIFDSFSHPPEVADAAVLSVASNAITANAIAANAIDANALATDAITEIQGTIPTDVAAIKTQTDKFAFTTANRVDATAIGVPTTDNTAAIAAIKLKTDQFAFTVANQVDSNVITKTGFSLSQAFPTNFSSLAITGGGAVMVDALPTIPTDWISAAGVSVAAVNKIQSGLSTYGGGDTAGTATLLSRLSATRAGYLDNLSVAPPTVSQIWTGFTSGTVATNLVTQFQSGLFRSTSYTAPNNAGILSAIAALPQDKTNYTLANAAITSDTIADGALTSVKFASGVLISPQAVRNALAELAPSVPVVAGSVDGQIAAVKLDVINTQGMI
jgi:hypothetical protein